MRILQTFKFAFSFTDARGTRQYNFAIDATNAGEARAIVESDLVRMLAEVKK
jgi:hypothetical protein